MLGCSTMIPDSLKIMSGGLSRDSPVLITYSLCLHRFAGTFTAAFDLPPECRKALGLAAPFSAPCLEIIENYLR